MTPRNARSRLPLFVSLLVALMAATAAAAPPSLRGRALELYEQGFEAFDRRDYDTAIRLLKQAWQTEANTTFLFNIGVVQEEAGYHADALETYGRYLAVATDAEGRADAERRVAAVKEAFGKGWLTIRTDDGSAATARVGDQGIGTTPVERAVVPKGTHTVRIEAPGRPPVELQVVVQAGEEERVDVTLPPRLRATVEADIEASSWTAYDTWGTVSVTSGAAMLAGGVTLLVLADRDRGDFEAMIGGPLPARGMTRAEALELKDTVDLESALGIGLTAAGGAALVTGLVLLLIDETPEPEGPSVRLYPSGLAGLTFDARF